MWEYLDILMLIGQTVWWTVRALLGAISPWDLLRYPGWAGSRSRWLWALPKQDILLLAWPHVRQSGCESSSVSCLDLHWIPLWFSITTRGGIRLLRNPCIRWLLQQIDIIWVMVIWWARRLHHIKMMYRLIHLVKASRKDLIRDFPKWLGVGKKPLYKGPACYIHWALGALRACGSY